MVDAPIAGAADIAAPICMIRAQRSNAGHIVRPTLGQISVLGFQYVQKHPPGHVAGKRGLGIIVAIVLGQHSPWRSPDPSIVTLGFLYGFAGPGIGSCKTEQTIPQCTISISRKSGGNCTSFSQNIRTHQLRSRTVTFERIT